MTQRTERIDELLRQEIGELLSREVADPRIGFATVTEVETAPDLRHARVWISVIGQRGEREETIAALQRAMSFVRLDDSAERGTRVLQLITELESGSTPELEAPPDESLPTPVARLRREGDAADTPEAPEADTEPALPDAPPAGLRRPGSPARRRGNVPSAA